MQPNCLALSSGLNYSLQGTGKLCCVPCETCQGDTVRPSGNRGCVSEIRCEDVHASSPAAPTGRYPCPLSWNSQCHCYPWNRFIFHSLAADALTILVIIDFFYYHCGSCSAAPPSSSIPWNVGLIQAPGPALERGSGTQGNRADVGTQSQPARGCWRG